KISQEEAVNSLNTSAIPTNAVGKATSPQELLIQDVIKKVSSKFQISEEQVLSRNNQTVVKKARQVCMFIIRDLGINLSLISKTFDGRGNSSILNAIKNIKEESNLDAELKSFLEQIKVEVL
ncbi:MAG TPA: helix-turn-helix domain-containing protein, partial [Vampirovibrionales bacterium]